ncbi:hypothetical protein AB6A40_008031 [Gnathostoma spinigerum]|uniref:Uncharacterized protein n=1 Tax=Gnathostoma spinigerum TaxID=75299 RepID=A0ABD6EXK4_9BILA
MGLPGNHIPFVDDDGRYRHSLFLTPKDMVVENQINPRVHFLSCTYGRRIFFSWNFTILLENLALISGIKKR